MIVRWCAQGDVMDFERDLAQAAEIIRRVWDTTLIIGNDPTKPVVTIGKLAEGIVLLGLAYLGASIISRWLAGKLLNRLRLDKRGVAPLQSLTFYSLLA